MLLSNNLSIFDYRFTEMHGSAEADVNLESVGSAVSRADFPASARHRFASSQSPEAFFASKSIISSPSNMDPFFLRLKQNQTTRLNFSSSSSNDSPGSNSPSARAALAARKRLQQLLSLRSLSFSSRRCSNRIPLSPIENLQSFPLSARPSPSHPIYKTPVKFEVEEDVLVMDVVSKSLSMPNRSRKTVDLITPSSSPSSVNFINKTEICRSWEDYGLCRFGSRCQFAHGNEELRGSPLPSKLNPESGKQISAVDRPAGGNRKVMGVSTVACEEKLRQGGASFSWPPTEAGEAEIEKALYGPSRMTGRLPVFRDICPE